MIRIASYLLMALSMAAVVALACRPSGELDQPASSADEATAPSPETTPTAEDVGRAEALQDWYVLLRNEVYLIEGVLTAEIVLGGSIRVIIYPNPGVREEVEALLTRLDIPLEAVTIQVLCPNVGQMYHPPAPLDDSTLRSLVVQHY